MGKVVEPEGQESGSKAVEPEGQVSGSKKELRSSDLNQTPAWSTDRHVPLPRDKAQEEGPDIILISIKPAPTSTITQWHSISGSKSYWDKISRQ